MQNVSFGTLILNGLIVAMIKQYCSKIWHWQESNERRIFAVQIDWKCNLPNLPNEAMVLLPIQRWKRKIAKRKNILELHTI